MPMGWVGGFTGDHPLGPTRLIFLSFAFELEGQEDKTSQQCEMRLASGSFSFRS